MSCMNAVVTGGSRGIGYSVVIRLLEAGYKVIVCSRSQNSNVNSLVEKFGSDRVVWCYLDLANPQVVSDSAKKISKSCDRIDLLVNCAGVAQGSAFLMTKLEDLVTTFNINYFNTLLFSQIIAKKMIRKREGVVVNVVSTAGLLTEPGTLAYGGSKAALIHSTGVLAQELGAFGIRVNSVAPAIVNTEMGSLNDSKTVERHNQRSALDGITEPDDVADLILFLASNEHSSKITGQVFRIDRGLH